MPRLKTEDIADDRTVHLMQVRATLTRFCPVSTLDFCRHYGDNNPTPTIPARGPEIWACLGTGWRVRWEA